MLSFFSVRWNKIPSADALGNFDLLLDEELAAQEEQAQTAQAAQAAQPSTKGRGGGGNRWK